MGFPKTLDIIKTAIAPATVPTYNARSSVANVVKWGFQRYGLQSDTTQIPLSLR